MTHIDKFSAQVLLVYDAMNCNAIWLELTYFGNEAILTANHRGCTICT
uniref:Uncharacterized protein n=1 Tax=Lepeophtheirus salmonis TaxID=72036 RepID=A0A0K2TYS1_LEPSM